MGDWDRLTRRSLIGVGGAAAVATGTAFALRGSGRGRRSLAGAGTFNRGNAAEPDTLDPHLASTQYENNIIGDMFMGLMTENAAGDPVPGAALSYMVSADGLVYTFRLRDHKWSDGVPVTAHDYVYSFRRILNPKTAAQYSAILYPIRNAKAVNGGALPLEQLGVRALDDHTLEITFEIEVPYIAQLLTHYSTFAVPAHAIEKYGQAWLRPGNAVGNGAYVLKEWLPNDHILLEKNPYFYDAGNVKIERVFFYPTQDYSAALKRFRAGELDMNLGVPPQEIGWLRASMPSALHIVPFLLTQYVLFNVKQKPFDDVRVREALSLAIDREIIAAKVMHAGEKPAYSLVPPHIPDYPGTAAIRFRGQPMDERIARATALLSEAGYGWKNPLAFDFNIQDQTDSRLIAVALQSMWKNVGAQIRILPSDDKNHYNLLLKQAFSVAWSGWVADYRDAKDYLLIGQSSAKDLNNGAYASPKFDALISQADRTADPQGRGRLLAGAEQVMLDDVALAPVYFAVSRTLVSPAVQGWVDNQINTNRSRYLRLDRSKAIA